MGYYATGSGDIVFNDKFDDTAKTALEAYLKESSPAQEYSFISYDGKCELCMIAHDKYYQVEWQAFFKHINGYVESGKITFTGEDNTHWRFRYDPASGTWKEENGRVVYDVRTCYISDDPSSCTVFSSAGAALSWLLDKIEYGTKTGFCCSEDILRESKLDQKAFDDFISRFSTSESVAVTMFRDKEHKEQSNYDGSYELWVVRKDVN